MSYSSICGVHIRIVLTGRRTSAEYKPYMCGYDLASSCRCTQEPIGNFGLERNARGSLEIDKGERA